MNNPHGGEELFWIQLGALKAEVSTHILLLITD